MTIYVDTSLVVALLTQEPATDDVTQWFSAAADDLVSADWCAVEFASTIARKQRTGQLSPAHAESARTVFKELTAGGLRLLPVSRAVFNRAADLVQPYQHGLRAGDALHLAVALEAGAEVLAGLDKTMNASAHRHGLRLAI